MKLSLFDAAQSQAVIDLFEHVFTNSEGTDEGKVIRKLVTDLITSTDKNDLIGFTANAQNEVLGSIFFSRLSLTNNKTAFLLSPVAIATKQQGKGLGQELITYGIDHLKSLNIDLLFTYGDPNFYSKVGFQQISESSIKAPHELSQPIGWLAQSLKDSPLNMTGWSSKCVAALDDKKYW